MGSRTLPCVFIPLTGTMTLFRQALFSGPTQHINALDLSFYAAVVKAELLFVLTQNADLT